jgi:hypothetical protein
MEIIGLIVVIVLISFTTLLHIINWLYNVFEDDKDDLSRKD